MVSECHDILPYTARLAPRLRHNLTVLSEFLMCGLMLISHFDPVLKISGDALRDCSFIIRLGRGGWKGESAKWKDPCRGHTQKMPWGHPLKALLGKGYEKINTLGKGVARNAYFSAAPPHLIINEWCLMWHNLIYLCLPNQHLLWHFQSFICEM